MFDACRIDGATDWQIYWHVALPLTRSMLGVVAVLNILGTWNNLIWPTLTLSGTQNVAAHTGALPPTWSSTTPATGA